MAGRAIIRSELSFLSDRETWLQNLDVLRPVQFSLLQCLHLLKDLVVGAVEALFGSLSIATRGLDLISESADER